MTSQMLYTRVCAKSEVMDVYVSVSYWMNGYTRQIHQVSDNKTAAYQTIHGCLMYIGCIIYIL